MQNPTMEFLKNRNADPEKACFFWNGGPVDVDKGVYFQSMFAGCTGFETKEGLFLVDSGPAMTAPILSQMLRQKTNQPLHTVLYTHGHVDHAFGTQAFLGKGEKPKRVVAHENARGRFARYNLTAAHNQAINARQFGGTVEGSASSTYQLFHDPIYLPDTWVGDHHTLEVGGRQFEVRHGKGETDDALWVFEPATGILCTGDLFIWACPNAGNPQKVQRYPWEWAKALREMAALEPVSLCPGHGAAVVKDPAKVRRMLLETAEFLESIVEQTLAALNDGSPPHVDIVHRVKLPEARSPWLKSGYDDAEFLIRSVIRFYGGWWTGRPSELKPAPRDEVAAELAAMAGGAKALAKRALELLEQGRSRLAGHLADYALEAAPQNPEIRDSVAKVYGRRGDEESSLMASNLFQSAAAYARAGRPFR